MNIIPKIYVASPEVFLPNIQELITQRVQVCERFNAVCLHPGINVVDPTDHFPARSIFKANCDLICKSDIVIANLNPYMGSWADTGTVWETGFAWGLGKLVFGYQNSGIDRDLNSRVSRSICMLESEGILRNSEGFAVDDLSECENTMIMESILGMFDSFESAVEGAVRQFRLKFN